MDKSTVTITIVVRAAYNGHKSTINTANQFVWNIAGQPVKGQIKFDPKTCSFDQIGEDVFPVLDFRGKALDMLKVYIEHCKIREGDKITVTGCGWRDGGYVHIGVGFKSVNGYAKQMENPLESISFDTVKGISSEKTTDFSDITQEGRPVNTNTHNPASRKTTNSKPKRNLNIK